MKDNFKNGNDWGNKVYLVSISYKCWNCNREIAANSGYKCNGVYNNKSIYICPHCEAPTIIDIDGKEYPNLIPGKEINKLPENIDYIYNEARSSLGCGAYTGCIMLLRKIIMNLAVEYGEKEGESFKKYVDFLCKNGFVHKKQAKQADNIRKLGNDANHEIEKRTKGEAEELLKFVELLLINNYEFADEE
ncbi:MAG: hypothetical protein Ta2D_06720 [Rickettsiales bacterium]|nr:MAG: hypothetical protein Ta2D_06720 [Rickettsiales bacterium]